MIHFRTFRNTDPPDLVRVWNDAFVGRGTILLRSASLMEYFLLCKSYFDPQGLIVAADRSRDNGRAMSTAAQGTPVGFALTGFAPHATGYGLDRTTGIICAFGVTTSYRRKGIGTELLRRAEEYLRQSGATTILAGPKPPLNPFTFGLYGGCQSPGYLESNENLGPFLLKRGYESADSVLVLQRHLDRPFNVIDGRFPALRRGFEVKTLPRKGADTWYAENVRGPLDFLSFQVEDRSTQRSVGQARIWEMEPFSVRWNESAVGIVDISIDESVRRQGVARLLLGNIMRFLHDQYFTLVEAQVDPGNNAGIGLFRGLGFQQIDVGHRYRRKF